MHIWDDRWIPIPDSFSAISPRAPQAEAELVSDLIDVDKKIWDVAKVRSIFLHQEAKVVLGIPISNRMQEDSFIWAWTINGKFTVESAFGVAQKWLKEGSNRSETGSSSDNSKMKAIWKMTWKLNFHIRSNILCGELARTSSQLKIA